jgi:hypothetical protein
MRLWEGMNNPKSKPFPGKPVVTITEHSYWPCCKSGPAGVVRPVVGPHSPFCDGRRLSLPLTYTLKVIEPASCKVISKTRVAGPEEALAALKLLGPTPLQPVLVGRSTVQFLPRAN